MRGRRGQACGSRCQCRSCEDECARRAVKAVNCTKYSPQKPEDSRTILSADHALGAYPLVPRATVVVATVGALSFLACVLARLGFGRAAWIVGSSRVAVRIFPPATLLARRVRVRHFGKKPLGRRPGVLQGLRLRRRRDLSLRCKHAQAQGARYGASEQEKVFHRDGLLAGESPRFIGTGQRTFGVDRNN
jgi:hypothetical protein